MEFGGNALFYALGIPLLILCAAVIAQRIRIAKLEKEIDSITLKFQVEASSPKEIRNELFAACPYPVCIIDPKGKILARNPGFRKLAPAEIKDLQEFDDATQGSLRHLPLSSRRYTHRLLTLKNERGDFRQFNVVAWPIWGPQVQVGTVLAFHEQTKVLQRKLTQLHFEQQLVAYITLLTAKLEEVLQPVQRGLELEREQAVVLLEGYAKEMRLLFSHLTDIHADLRQPNHHEIVNVVKLTQAVLKEHRKTMQAKSLHLVSTLPKESQALGHYRDTVLALHALCNAVFLHAEPKATVRLHIFQDDRQMIAEFSLPDQQLKAKEIEHAFSFGGHGKGTTTMMRLWRLQLSVARELVSKYNGQVTLSSEPETGSVYRLIFVAAQKEPRE